MLGFWKDKTCDVCANAYKDFKNNYDSLNRENDRYRKDERMLSYFLKGFEEMFNLDSRIEIDYSCPSMLEYSMFVLRMFRVFDKLNELKLRVDTLEDITKRKDLEQRVKDLEEELSLRTKEHEKLLKTIKLDEGE